MRTCSDSWTRISRNAASPAILQSKAPRVLRFKSGGPRADRIRERMRQARPSEAGFEFEKATPQRASGAVALRTYAERAGLSSLPPPRPLVPNHLRVFAETDASLDTKVNSFAHPSSANRPRKATKTGWEQRAHRTGAPAC